MVRPGGSWTLARAVEARLAAPSLSRWASAVVVLASVTPQGASANLGMKYPVTDAAQSSYIGVVSGERPGAALVGLPDLNGDALPDLAMGMPGRGGGKGAVVVFFGGPDGLPEDLELAHADLIFNGESSAQGAGSSLGVGDFNGDGLSDLVVGAPGSTSQAGAVYVVFGRESFTGDPLAQDLGLFVKFTGEANGDQLGLAVAAPDVDGDGLSDLVVGAPYNDWAGTNAGRVYMRWGATGTQAGWSSGAVVSFQVNWFSTAFQNLGYSLARLPTFNKLDAREELAIGAPGGDIGFGNPTATPGRVYIVLGALRANFTSPVAIQTYNVGHFETTVTSDFAGAEVASAGDPTGDGYTDLLVGAPLRAVDAVAGRGKVWLIRGKSASYGNTAATLDATALGSYVGATSYQLAGREMAGVGDVTGDDIDDVLIGAPGYTSAPSLAGEVYLLAGGQMTWPSAGLLSNTAYVEGSFLGPGASSELGWALAGLGDIEGDGRVEVALGAPNFAVGGDLLGEVFIVDVIAVQDQDDDGYSLAAGDCDDEEAAVRPGALEIAYDGIDQNCDGEDLTDVDEDGFASTEVEGGTDCNDNSVGVYPGADEVPYDGIDQDCDGKDLTDVDEDGYKGGAGGADCDDSDPQVKPGGTEIPYDGIDQDCSGADLADLDGDRFNGGEGGADCDDTNSSVYPGASEVPYDGIDQDCQDGDLVDVDGDTYASTAVEGGTDCRDDDPNAYPGAAEVCNGEDDDCDGDTDEDYDIDDDGFVSAALCEGIGTDCDDGQPTVFPGAAERCDDLDNNCDGDTDEDLVLTTFWPDEDDDGYGTTASGASIEDCHAVLDGYAPNDDDCDDTDEDVNPGSSEIPNNGKDDDCNPRTTDDDLDGDGYPGNQDCDDSDGGVYPGAVEVPYDDVDQDCSGADLTDVDEDGFDGGDAGDDCDDTDPSVNPGESDTPYDGEDQDCSGDDLTDVDGDGYDGGEDGRDCDDADATVSPGAAETCNGKDDDCNGEQDEGCAGLDEDADGFFADVDCDDADPAVHPGAVEFCDAEDDLNCDGLLGEGCAEIGGGWGCSSSGGQAGGGWLGVFAVAGLLLRGRSRRAAAVVAACAHAGVASAADGALPELNQLDRPVDGLGLIGTTGAEGLIQRQFGVGLFYTYLNDPLQLLISPGADGDASSQVLVTGQSVVDLSGSYGLTRWLQVGVGVPLLSTQVTELGADVLSASGGVGAGPLRLNFKLSPLRSSQGFAAAVVPQLRVPFGGDLPLGVDVVAAVQQQAGRLKLVANAGYRASFGEAPSVAGRSLGTGAVLLRGGLALAAVPELVDLVADVWGQVGLGGDALVHDAPFEAGLAAVVRPGGDVYFSAGLGTSLSSGLGAAPFRAVLGLGYTSGTGLTDSDTDGDGIPDVWDECRLVEEDIDGWQDGDGCPDADNDGDGVADSADTCVDEAEDGDGWEDGDGCPEADNDGDTMPDDADQCRDEAEDEDGFQDEDGCPDLDNDSDGVTDVSDRCPDEAEDMDGEEDTDGCPDRDADNDGVGDGADRCQGVAEDLDGFQDTDGCPEDDNDRDDITDIDDFCPDVKEDANGFRDDDGCPESGPQVVQVRNEVRILEELRFKGDAAELDAKSRTFLDEAARLLRDTPQGKYIVIEAHTDSDGEREENLTRTQTQAQQVADYLASKGIDASRLVPIGYGEDRPMSTNRTERGKERNRRVVFVITDKAPSAGP